MTSSSATARAKLVAAISAMRQALEAASQAAHKLKDGQSEDDAEFDRLMLLGIIFDNAPMLCGPRLHVLSDIVDELLALDEEGDHAQPAQH